jgi:hypothetical protein
LNEGKVKIYSLLEVPQEEDQVWDLLPEMKKYRGDASIW